MNSSYLNMAAGAFLGTVFVVMSVSLMSEALFHAEDPEQEGFAIEVVEVSAQGGGEEEAATPIAELLAGADAAAGESSFRKCASCHTVEEGGANRVGPNLWDVVDRPIASHEGFSYSGPMQEFSEGGEVVWDYEHLAGFLADPRGYISGTAMSFAGLSREEELANVIAYLREQSGDPVPLPEPEAAPAEGEDAAAAEGEDAAAEEGGDAASEDDDSAAEGDGAAGENDGSETAPADAEGAAPDNSADEAEEAADAASGSDDNAGTPAADDGEAPAGEDTEAPAGNAGSNEDATPAQEQDGAPVEDDSASEPDDAATPAGEDENAPADEEASAGGDTGAEATGAAVALLAEADAANGERIFRRCRACHTIDEGGRDSIGPNLWNLVARPVASNDGFNYSEAMQAYSEGGDARWELARLDTYLTAPQDAVPGTRMAFPGVPDDADRADLLVYLRAQAGEPVALPDQ